jgi:hypothetical protein
MRREVRMIGGVAKHELGRRNITAELGSHVFQHNGCGSRMAVGDVGSIKFGNLRFNQLKIEKEIAR